MIRLSYKLTKRTKLKKIEKSLKMFKIYNNLSFNTIRRKLTASGNINHSILTYKLMRPVSFLLLPKELKKKQKTANSKN